MMTTTQLVDLITQLSFFELMEISFITFFHMWPLAILMILFMICIYILESNKINKKINKKEKDNE